PYACVFTYHCFNKLDLNPMPKNSGKWVTIILVLGSAVVLVFNFGKFYTTSTFLLLVLSLIYLQWVRKVNLTSFYLSYLVLLLPFALTNGILTGSFIESEVVWYNDLENIGLRIGTIPVEDIFYGMLLILWNIRLMEYFYQRNQSSNSVAG
ncbi:lycopene cyclase domain-containing protein, partial [Reichenbachiella sp.]